jgi:uncharacterized membrane protein
VRTSRLEAFSDGVMAIIITIMVLDVKVPQGETFEAFRGSATSLLTYALSFVYIGIYWNNHHHMFQLVARVTGGVLWANLTLLFCLSLLPLSTAWTDETGFARTPVITYGVNLLLCALAYWVLQSVVLRSEGADQPLRTALGRDVKAKISPVLYVLGIAGTFVSPWVGIAFYTVVAAIWLVPDRRVERYLAERARPDDAVPPVE